MSLAVSSTIQTKSESDWEPAHIAGFWDWCSRSPARRGQYFTAVVGTGIARFLSQHVALQGRLLDFGCGAGHLLDVLLQNRPQLEGIGLEFSKESVEVVERRLQGHLNWGGCM